MSTPHLVAPGRVIASQGFSRLRHGLILGVIALAVALFMWASVSLTHGIYAVIVLPLCALALALWGGPERLARRITVDSERLRIERFHTVHTTIEWTELTDASAQVRTTRRTRTRAEVVLDPVDAPEFFTRHRELRAVRVGDQAVIPAGRPTGLTRRAHDLTIQRATVTCAELTAALAALQPKNRHP